MAVSPSPLKRRRLNRSTSAASTAADGRDGHGGDALMTLDVATFERPEDEDGESDAELDNNDEAQRLQQDEDESEDDWSADESEASRGRSRGPAGGTTPTRRSARSISRAGSQTPTRKTPSKVRTGTPSKLRTRKAAAAAATAGPFVKLTASDAYFTAMSRPARTSANVFSDILPPLTHQQYTALLRTSTGAQRHEFAIEDLEHAHEVRWPGWARELDEGFNLLCYGLGSKREILNRFAQDVLVDRGDVVVVNGVFPRMGIRDVLATIETAIPDVKYAPGPPVSAQSTPVDTLAYRIYTHYLPLDLDPAPAHALAEDDLYLLIHGLDSPGLRTPQAKAVLGLLASSPRIHLVASIDHIQAPIMFSTGETYSRPHSYPHGWADGTAGGGSGVPSARGFNWLYHDVTTLRAYDAEVALRISTASRLPTAGSGAGLATEEGARHILTSVTDLARRLFKALAKSQIDSMSSSASSTAAAAAPAGAGLGSATPAWAAETALFFSLCKDKWIAREETRFKALLHEFKDHRLVVESTVPPAGGGDDADDADGAEGTGRKAKANARWLWIPLGREALGRLVEDLADVTD